ncbi:MAG: hypothetical protein PHW10_02610 [Candidatus Peribacteraceae bacterium]|nr:hypothetical protein [Candidatus Peribacteraceae bacterium]
MTNESPAHEKQSEVLQSLQAVLTDIAGREVTIDEASRAMALLESSFSLASLYREGHIDQELGDVGFKSIQKDLRALLGVSEPTDTQGQSQNSPK